MERATPATPEYKARFKKLTGEGWSLTNYGDGWRYFARRREDVPTRQDGMDLFDCCRVHESGGTVEILEPTWLLPKDRPLVPNATRGQR